MARSLTNLTLFIFFLLFGQLVCAEADSVDAATVTNASNLVNTLDAYYKEVNKQLDKRLNRRREPFSNNMIRQKENGEERVVIPGAAESISKKIITKYVPQEGGAFPEMTIKGYLEREGKKAALLEVAGLGVFVVQEGDRLGLHKMANVSSVLHVLQINELNMVLGFGTSGKEIVVQ